MIININTPIEEYWISGRAIFVKRDDKSTNPPAPPLAKLRGVSILLEKLYKQGIRNIGVVDTMLSKSAWGVAAIVKDLQYDMQVYCFYPKYKSEKELPDNQRQSELLGAKIIGLRGQRISIMFYQARKYMNLIEKSYMMPLGLTIIESVIAISDEAKRVPEKYLGGDLVVCVGSGMNLAGIIDGIGNKLNRIYGIGNGGHSLKYQRRNINSFGIKLPENLIQIQPEGIKYYDKIDTSKIPFPTSPYYDAKAFKWLLEHINCLKEPILFWNIGV